MKLALSPIVSITKAWFADSVRVVKGRLPGAFASIRNLIPSLSDGIGRVRPGFVIYNSSQNGKNAPTGMDILKICPIENPEQEDVHVYFVDDSGEKILLNPTWRGATKISTDSQINESKSFTGAAGSTPAANQLQITGSDALGLSSTDDYYNHWLMHNTTQDEYALITDYEYDSALAGTSTFTFVEDVNAGGLNWVATNAYVIYKNFHNNPTFAPSYNDDLSAPVHVDVQNSIIRLSGGVSSATGNRGIHVTPLLTRTFFQNESGRSFAHSKTYATERECKPFVRLDLIRTGFTVAAGATGGGLPGDKTYWIAFAPIYDGFQLGPLYKFEDPANDFAPGGNFLTNNYLSSSGDGRIDLNPTLRLSTIDKRITAFAIYVAQDDGNTSTTGRVAPYRFWNVFDLLDNHAAAWTFSATTGRYLLSNYSITSASFDNTSQTFQTDSGYAESTPDTMYAYSIEESIGGRRVMSNVYLTSQSETDKTFAFTAAVGGSSDIGNAGIVAPDIFPNLEGLNKIRIDPTVGTSIRGIHQIDIEEFLILKDRGLIRCRLVPIGQIFDLIQSVESIDVGLTTINAIAKDDEGWVVFPSYQDIYRYRNGIIQPLIERPDKNDWLFTYRESITPTEKENASVAYVPEFKLFFFFFGNNRSTATGFNTMQYIFSPMSGWTEARWAESSDKAGASFKYWTANRLGHRIGTTADTTAANIRLVWQYSGGVYSFVYQDGAGAIVPYFNTGDLYFGDSVDTILHKVLLNKNLGGMATQGTLTFALIGEDGVSVGQTNANKALLRVGVKLSPSNVRRSRSWRFLWNTDTADPERLNAGSSYHVTSLEFFGRQVPTRKRTLET